MTAANIQSLLTLCRSLPDLPDVALLARAAGSVTHPEL
jgi:hypothetical protein